MNNFLLSYLTRILITSGFIEESFRGFVSLPLCVCVLCVRIYLSYLIKVSFCLIALKNAHFLQMLFWYSLNQMQTKNRFTYQTKNWHQQPKNLLLFFFLFQFVLQEYFTILITFLCNFFPSKRTKKFTGIIVSWRNLRNHDNFSNTNSLFFSPSLWPSSFSFFLHLNVLFFVERAVFFKSG